MKVIKSKDIGYCLGVKTTINRAWDVLSLAKEKEMPSYSIGKLIHNEYVVRGFEMQGLKVISNPDSEPGIALVRAHGLPDAVKQEFRDRGFILVDSTCINILRNQDSIRDAHEKNRIVVIVGEKNHAETLTLLGTGDFDKYHVSDLSDLQTLYSKLKSDSSVSVAVQTTFSESLYDAISTSLEKYFTDIDFINHLCRACLLRKKNALSIVEQCDVVFVVGSSSSANTKELAAYIRQSGKPVFMAANVDELKTVEDKIKNFKTAGVCSGTSVPAEIIEQICFYLENL